MSHITILWILGALTAYPSAYALNCDTAFDSAGKTIGFFPILEAVNALPPTTPTAELQRLRKKFQAHANADTRVWDVVNIELKTSPYELVGEDSSFLASMVRSQGVAEDVNDVEAADVLVRLGMMPASIIDNSRGIKLVPDSYILIWAARFGEENNFHIVSTIHHLINQLKRNKSLRWEWELNGELYENRYHVIDEFFQKLMAIDLKYASTEQCYKTAIEFSELLKKHELWSYDIVGAERESILQRWAKIIKTTRAI